MCQLCAQDIANSREPCASTEVTPGVHCSKKAQEQHHEESDHSQNVGKNYNYGRIFSGEQHNLVNTTTNCVITETKNVCSPRSSNKNKGKVEEIKQCSLIFS